MDWESSPASDGLLAFVRDALAQRKCHPALERRRYFRGERVHGSELKDATWFRQDGQELTSKDWAAPENATLALLIDGQAMDELDACDNAGTDDLLCLVLNAEPRVVRYVLPLAVSRFAWEIALDSSEGVGSHGLAIDARDGRIAVDVPRRSVVLLRASRENG
jgi:isoamylase